MACILFLVLPIVHTADPFHFHFQSSHKILHAYSIHQGQKPQIAVYISPIYLIVLCSPICGQCMGAQRTLVTTSPLWWMRGWGKDVWFEWVSDGWVDNIVQGYFDHSKEEIENTLLWSLTLTVVCVCCACECIVIFTSRVWIMISATMSHTKKWSDATPERYGLISEDGCLCWPISLSLPLSRSMSRRTFTWRSCAGCWLGSLEFSQG